MDADRALAATQLLMSHLCHELVSPVGAINNGIEMLEDFGGNEFEPEAIALIGESGKAAAAKLRFYRLAYGSAGRASDLGLSQCAAAAAELLVSDPRVKLDWQAAGAVQLVAGGPQLLLNLVVLAIGTLPRGGRIALAVLDGGAKPMIRLVASGTGAKVSDGVQAVVGGQPGPLDHGNIHAWYCGQLAGQLGTRIRLAAAPDEVRIDVEIDRLAD